MRAPFTRTFRLAIVASLALLAWPMAAQDEDAADYRVETMKAIGGHTAGFFGVLQGKVPHTAHLPVHADALAALAKIAPSLFPAGSGEDTDARPEIWENPEDFAAKLAAFESAATGLAAAVAAGDAIGPAAQQLGQACKGCHDDYRAQ